MRLSGELSGEDRRSILVVDPDAALVVSLFLLVYPPMQTLTWEIPTLRQ